MQAINKLVKQFRGIDEILTYKNRAQFTSTCWASIELIYFKISKYNILHIACFHCPNNLSMLIYPKEWNFSYEDTETS
jgi:hypothetical protein